MVVVTPDQLEELLPVYYKKLFPLDLFCSWLNYGSEDYKKLSHREMSFTLAGDVYIRYQSFDSPQEFEQELIKKCPEKIDIGAIYNFKPRQKRLTTHFDVEEKELVFDIDMTDYDSVRTCCKEAEICNKCWKLLAIATKVIDIALREDFGFEHILWVFSGRRGIHCWVCDEVARKLEPKVRADIAEYLNLFSKEDASGKAVHISSYEPTHPLIKRAIRIIRNDFEDICVVEQDMLGTPESSHKVLMMLGDKLLKEKVESSWADLTTSLDRWKVLEKVYHDMQSKNLLKRQKYLIDELMLHFAYPRLDIEVSKSSNHLLKAPFCIHPKTGKICVPFSASIVDKFDPQTVPTILDLIDEIQKFDAKCSDKDSDVTKSTVENYEKTSMLHGVQVFKDFITKLKKSFENKKPVSEGLDF